MEEEKRNRRLAKTAFAESFSFVVKMNVYFGVLSFAIFSIITPFMDRHFKGLPLPSHYFWILVGAASTVIILALTAKFHPDVKRHFSQEHQRTRTAGKEGPTPGASMYQMMIGMQIGIVWAGTPSISVALGFTAVFLAILAYYPVGRKRALKRVMSADY
jgi:hypothetical protein